MSTAKQAASNQANASKSTGPKTAAGKETAAGNAFKHGITALKYLAPDEDPKEFAVHYAARRAHHLAADPLVDDLVRKITLIHWRFDRAFRSEAVMLKSSSLDELFVDYRAPIKNLTGYTAANRKLLQTLTAELAAYEKAEAERRATSSIADDGATPSEPPPPTEPPPAASTSDTPTKEDPIGTPITMPDPASSAPSSDAVAPKKAPISRGASTTTPAAANPMPSSPTAATSAESDRDRKTKPNSTEGCKPATPVSTAASPAVPAAGSAPTSKVSPPQPSIYQAKFDLPTWGNAQ